MWKKYLSLFLLTTQNSLHILSLSYVRTRKTENMFFSSTAIIVSEMLKVAASLLILFIQEGSVGRLMKHLHTNIILQPMDCVKVAVPSFIYTLQNNLLFVALSNLEAATFQVYYQMKILTAALFSFILLNKRLSVVQWTALVLLTFGVALVKLSSTDMSSNNNKQHNHFKGVLAVAISCLMSGFAGVYFEKILKGTKQTVILRNVQLGVFGMFIAYLTMELKEGTTIHEKGFFYGYDVLVCVVISLQALGGLVVAFVVKYADNILKGFATSIAIITSSVASVFLLNFHITLEFSLGASLVILSVFLYSKFPPKEVSLPVSLSEGKVRTI